MQQLHDELCKEDAEMNKIYEQGMVDGYDGKYLVCLQRKEVLVSFSYSLVI